MKYMTFQWYKHLSITIFILNSTTVLSSIVRNIGDLYQPLQFVWNLTLKHIYVQVDIFHIFPGYISNLKRV